MCLEPFWRFYEHSEIVKDREEADVLKVRYWKIPMMEKKFTIHVSISKRFSSSFSHILLEIVPKFLFRLSKFANVAMIISREL